MIRSLASVTSRRFGAIAAVVACTISWNAANAAPVRYHLVDLGAGTSARAVDAKGDVAGSIGYDALPQAAVYRDGAWVALDAVTDGLPNHAGDIDVHGGVIYTYWDFDADFNQRIYSAHRSPGGETAGIVLPDDPEQVYAQGLARDGSVVGYVGGGLAGSRCFAWRAGRATYLASAGDQCAASGINDARQVSGGMNTSPGGDVQAFRWEDGQVKLLGTLGGTYSYGFGINQAGHVAMAATNDVGTSHAALHDGLQLIDLGVPAGGIESFALALNDRDVVVGSWYDSLEHAFIARNGRIVDLSGLVDDLQGIQLGGATGINDDGVIVGNGIAAGVPHAWMLLPIGR